MPVQTDFGKLTLYSATGEDAQQSFLKFRNDIAGTDPDSNFNKIENILASQDSFIENSRRIFDVTAQKVSENYYESNDLEIDKYYPDMLIILSVTEPNTGNVTIRINNLADKTDRPENLGIIPIKKYDSTGNLVELSANDLIPNVKYLLEFTDEAFIMLNQITSNEVLEKIKAIDGSGSGLDADLLDGKQSSDFATSEQGLKADTAIQSVKGNGELISPDENNSVNITPKNIGAAEKIEFTATLSDVWQTTEANTTEQEPQGQGYVQNVRIEGIRESDNPIVGIILHGTATDTLSELASWNYVSKIDTYDGGICVTCYKNKPKISMNIRLLCIR